MKKFDLFLLACKAERWKWRSWTSTIFNVSRLPPDFVPEPYDIDYREDGIYYYDGQLKAWAIIEDAKAGEPLYDFRYAMDFPADHFPNHPKPIRTTYGRAIYNWICVIWPFGDKVEFQNKKMNAKSLVPIFAPRTVDDDVDTNGTNLVKASNVENHLTALSQLTSLAPLIAPTGSERTFIASKEVRKFIKAELAKCGGKPTRQQLVEISKQAVELDKKYLAEDGESLDFYVSGATLKVRRFKQLYMFGAVDAFHEDGDYDLITESLDEGIPTDKLPALFNDARQGSFDRGADTAKGGYGVSNYMQITQNIKVSPEPCGTKITQTIKLDDHSLKLYGIDAGFNKMVTGKAMPIDKSDVGKVIQMRRPLLCKHKPPGFCADCVGHIMSKTERGAASGITQIQSYIMYGFMSAMHGNEQDTAEYDFRRHIR
ncbi:MAG: hypothetical protein ACRDDY_13880 [Clostridium sp.]|uniref:hypothetical protein n=1 Tax=Clostridium sp. TaxID=1506 RepID=UPI003EE81AA5